MKLLRYLPRFQQAYRQQEVLAQREQWSRCEIEAWQLERINRVWQHALEHVPYYQKLAARHRLPPRFTSLEQYRERVPLVTKAPMKQRPEQFLSRQAGRGCWGATSGSTGAPTRFFIGQRGHHEMLQTRYRHHAMYGVDIFDRTIFLWNTVGQTAPLAAAPLVRLRQQLQDRLRQRRRLSGYNLSPDRLQKYLVEMQRYRPAMLYGYSTAVYLLAREAQQQSFACDSLKLIIATSEPVHPHMTTTIEQGLGAPVAIEYGSTECGVVASQWPDGLLRVREDIAYVETLPRDDGQYDLVISMLNNTAFPLLRYSIGDVTDSPLEMPRQGFAVLKNVTGRSNDVVVTAAGGTVHPAKLEVIFEKELQGQVRYFQIYQHRDGAVSVQVELDRREAPFDLRRLRDHMAQLVEGYPVEARVVDRIPRTAAGKHRWIISELAAERHGSPSTLASVQ